MSGTPDDATPPKGGSLDLRVRSILGETPGSIAFNGLRRALGAHPESLSRALRRLEHDGVIERRSGGYALVGRMRLPDERSEIPPARTVAEVTLDVGSDATSVLGSLAGRWFGELRWVGIFDRAKDPWLVWSVGSLGKVMLSHRRGTLRVLIDSRAETPSAPVLEAAARELLLHALEAARRSGGARPAPPAGALTFRLDEERSSGFAT